MEIFIFDRPVPTQSSETKLSKKCTCFHRRSSRPKSTPIPQEEQSSSLTSLPSSSFNESMTPVNSVNRHSLLMQTVTLNAYHTDKPQRSSIKSCSLLNDTKNHQDTPNDSYEFVDNTKKASFLTGSARCILVTVSAAFAATNKANAHTNNGTITSTTSRTRFRKSTSR